MRKNEPAWKQRYRDAYEYWYSWKYPLAYKDHGLPKLKFPKVATANGLTKMITNFLNWRQHRATRINVQGRLTVGSEKQESGITLQVKKWQSSTTRRGTADISATIGGRSVMIEIKIGKDKPSEYQIMEQERERRAGGMYEFIHNPEEFFELYDRIVVNL